MADHRAYRILCGVLGVLASLFGLSLLVSFFRVTMPGGTMEGPLSPLGPNGVYFMAFTGCAMLGWGGGLLSAMRRPESHRTVGTASALALVLMAFYRMWAWLLGDYYRLGDLLRVEAALFLLLALALVWLRPPRADAAG